LRRPKPTKDKRLSRLYKKKKKKKKKLMKIHIFGDVMPHVSTESSVSVFRGKRTV
jgi:hypothetical protein